MDNFENLSQEELLEAAQKAYEEQASRCEPTLQPPCHQEQEQPVVEEPVTQGEEPALEEETSVEQEQQDSPSLPASVSTNGTAIGIATGLVLGAGVGFLTGQVAPCLTIGVLLGVLIGLFFDVKKDKKAVAPKHEKDQVSVPTILEEPIQEDECDE